MERAVGQVLHGCVRMMQAVRPAIQPQRASIRNLARQSGISPTKIQRWHKQTTTAYAAMGPGQPVFHCPDSALMRCSDADGYRQAYNPSAGFPPASQMEPLPIPLRPLSAQKLCN